MSCSALLEIDPHTPFATYAQRPLRPWAPRDGMKQVRECVHGTELDLQTLVWTRGAGFPLARLESRMKCPRCGSRRVVLLFEPPSDARTRMVGVG
jgi:hypothetical protein